MDARADELVEGPRGRRMLWELASRAEPSLGGYAWAVVRDLETTATFTFGWPVTDGTVLERAGSPAEVAARLGALADGAVAPAGALGDALSASVDAARPWQEPDGTDVMLADPVFDEPLRAWGERVVRMPEAGWLWHPLAGAQRVARFFYDDLETRAAVEPRRPDPAATAAGLAAWRARSLDEERQFAGHAANYPDQELTGAWWSLPGYTAVWSTGTLADGSPAALHFIEDGAGEAHARVWTAAPRAGARVLEIAGPEDWAQLCRRHPFDVSESRRHTWRLATGRTGRWVLPDWPAVAAEWDAVHVTGAGYLRGAERAIDVDAEAGTATVLAGWAPGAAVWLGEALEVADEPVDWRLADGVWAAAGES